MTYSIYLLKHPKTKRVIYVGCTMMWSARRNAHRSLYQRVHGYKPLFEVVEQYNDEYTAKVREKELIDVYRKKNPALHNGKNYNPGKSPHPDTEALAGAELTKELNEDFLSTLTEINEL